MRIVATKQPEPSSHRRGSAKAALIVLVALLVLGGGFAVWYFLLRGPSLPPDLKLVSADSTGFVTVRVADLWESNSAKEMREKFAPFLKELEAIEEKAGIKLSDVERVTIVFPDADSIDDNLMWLIVAAKKPFDQEKIKKLAEADTEAKANGKVYFRSDSDKKPAIHFHSDRIAVVGQPEAVENFLEQKIKSDGRLAKSLERAAEKHHFTAGFAVPEKFKDRIRDSLKRAKGDPKTEMLKPLLELESATVTYDFDKDLKGELIADFSSEKKAEKAKKALEEVITLAKAAVGQMPEELPKEMRDLALETLKGIEVKQDDESVVISVNVKDYAARVLPAMMEAVQKVREAAARMEGSNNLKQIGIAFHNHADSHNGVLPGPIRDKNGKALLSWRVAILPYVEQNNLYKQFKLDEPWDSEHNKKLLSQMPKLYTLPYAIAEKPGHTYLQVFTGDKTLFTKMGQPFKIFTIPDGSSNTILVTESRNAVPWTAPQELVYSDQVDPRTLLGQPGKSFFLALLGDGSVRSLHPTIAEKTLRFLIMPNDLQVIDQDF